MISFLNKLVSLKKFRQYKKVEVAKLKVESSMLKVNDLVSL